VEKEGCHRGVGKTYSRLERQHTSAEEGARFGSEQKKDSVRDRQGTHTREKWKTQTLSKGEREKANADELKTAAKHRNWTTTIRKEDGEVLR